MGVALVIAVMRGASMAAATAVRDLVFDELLREAARVVLDRQRAVRNQPDARCLARMRNALSLSLLVLATVTLSLGWRQ